MTPADILETIRFAWQDYISLRALDECFDCSESDIDFSFCDDDNSFVANIRGQSFIISCDPVEVPKPIPQSQAKLCIMLKNLDEKFYKHEIDSTQLIEQRNFLLSQKKDLC